LIPAGNAIMGGLNESLKDKFKDVKSTISGVAGEIINGFDLGNNTQNIGRNVVRGLSGNFSRSNEVRKNQPIGNENRAIEIQVPVYLYPDAPREIGYATATYVEERNNLINRTKNRLGGIR